MIGFDVDMGYLLEEGELDHVVLHDENGEYRPLVFYPSSSKRKSYDAGFKNGVKACLQQLDGLIHEGADADEIQAWADRQWEEEV